MIIDGKQKLLDKKGIISKQESLEEMKRVPAKMVESKR